MTHRFIALAALLAAFPAYAGDRGAKAADVQIEPATPRWRVGAAYAPIFGLETTFSGLGTFGSAFTPQPIAPGTSYEYDDGYVRVDSSGNAGGQTWNWGYENASQYDGGSSIAMSLSSSNSNASAKDEDIAQGVDVFTYLDMGKAGFNGIGGRSASWGFRGGLHYAKVGMESNSALSASTTTIRDTYTVTSGVVPGAPYNGTFSGPGPLLSDTPVRDVLAGTAIVVGSRDLDVHLATFSVGSYLEIPVTDDFHVLLEGGLNAAIASGDYDFESSTTITGLGTVQSSGSDSDTKILPGLYLGVTGIYQLNDKWALQFSGRYQYMDNFKLEDNGSEANLNFDSAFILSLGAVYSF